MRAGWDAIWRRCGITARLVNHLKLQRQVAYLKRKINDGEGQKEKQRIKTVRRATQKYYQQRERSEGR